MLARIYDAAQSNFNKAYIGKRDDVLSLLPYTAKRVLDIGCSVGTLGAAIKKTLGAHMTGVELSKKMANVASSKLDRVLCGKIEDIFERNLLEDCSFDVIIFSDVLEHLENPWGILKKSLKYLTSDGTIIASIPNVRHIDTIYNLILKGYWPYRERGIHDHTHLRFFTKRNIFELFDAAGLTITKLEVTYRIFEWTGKYRKLSNLIRYMPCNDFFAFQYLIVANITTKG